MDNRVPVPAQRSLPARPVTSFHGATLTTLWKTYDAQPIYLQRTREGRKLSRVRYRRAEEFLLPPALDGRVNLPDFLYFAGVAAQLALSSHLLDVGFPDAWCARHIGLHVERSLAYANASGLGYDCGATMRLIKILSPYWKWNHRHLIDRPSPNDGGFTPTEIRGLLRALADHVAQVTGHGRSGRQMRRP